MATLVDIDLVTRSLHRGYEKSARLYGVVHFGAMPGTKVYLSQIVCQCWYNTKLLSDMFSTFVGDAEDHAYVREFCKDWRNERDPATFSYIHPHEAWLARSAVSSVLGGK